MQIPHAHLLGAAVAVALVGISAAFVYYTKKPKGVVDEYEENEKVLRKFDLNMAYRPCAGMSRLARWERARALGLNPPEEIEHLLKSGKVGDQSLWDGRL